MNANTHAIKQLAQDLGFDKIGITDARQPQKSQYLDAWLRKEYHGTMTWMKTRQAMRSDIRKLFPAAKSVICVAHNYYVPREWEDNEGNVLISRYAWGHDYHKLMKKKLKLLLRQIQQLFPDVEGRICVDTAPVMEKIWAEKAGIGWQGKHTNLITRELGSWVFLGEIILDKSLAYDSPATDMCGSCSQCIQACPTHAIISPYVLDANKCISYLTIEYRDKTIPEEFIGKFNNYVFGCDICQDVCPWNKYQKETAESAYHPHNNNQNAPVKDLKNMSEQDFRARFKKSPVMRTGWKNFLRNIEFAFRSVK